MAKTHIAKWYHLLLYPDWFRRLHQRPNQFLGAIIEPGMITADIGCGLGFYAIEMARMVGEKGRVLAIDFQPKMLRFTERKVRKAGFSERVKIVQCSQDDLIVSMEVDFALSMWVAHEVQDRCRFFRQIRKMLKPNGRYLLAEPRLHVGRDLYSTICNDAEEVGLERISEPAVGGSWATLFVAVSE
jgi:ubiquinone/menaquinone biosynthesis C-methylase UbiE